MGRFFGDTTHTEPTSITSESEMKRILTSVFLLLVSPQAFAESRHHDEGGCSVEQSNVLCLMFGILPVIVVVFNIWDNYKMKTDPVYRARAEQLRRED